MIHLGYHTSYPGIPRVNEGHFPTRGLTVEVPHRDPGSREVDTHPKGTRLKRQNDA